MKQIRGVKRNDYYIGNIMGELSEYAKRYIFKMVHVDNMEYVLSTGICAKHHPKAEPEYVAIGDPELAAERENREVPCDPESVLTDYVPFYFNGRMPMLSSIIHADCNRKEYWEIDSPYRKSRYGPNKTKQWKQEDIVFILCRLDEVLERCPKWCFTDKHANSPHANFYTRLEDMDRLAWNVIDNYPEIMTEDIRLRRQAEFLVRDFVPLQCIRGITVRTEQVRERLEPLLPDTGKFINLSFSRYSDLYFYNDGK